MFQFCLKIKIYEIFTFIKNFKKTTVICNKLIFELENVFINPCPNAIILMENLPKKHFNSQYYNS